MLIMFISVKPISEQMNFLSEKWLFNNIFHHWLIETCWNHKLGLDWNNIIHLGILTCYWLIHVLSYHLGKRAAFNTLRPRQDGRHFADDIFKYVFLIEYVWISIKISLKFVPMGPINNIPAMVQIMAWRRPGNKPLSEPMVINLLKHICVARPQWVKWLCFFFSKLKLRFQVYLPQKEPHPIQLHYHWHSSQYCGCWWPGALAPGHQ